MCINYDPFWWFERELDAEYEVEQQEYKERLQNELFTNDRTRTNDHN